MTDTPSETTFASRLDHLFRNVKPAGRQEFTYDEVASGATASGFDISAAYVWQLRNGKRTNPTLRHLEGLASFFGVPASYFLDPATAASVDAQLKLFAAMRRTGVQQIAVRADGLSSESLVVVEELIEHLRKLERLDEPPSV